jgi:hypothetical protein
VDQLTAPEYNGLVRKYKETTAPPEKESSATGTWTLQEDQNGKPVLFNSKTGETKAPPPGMQKAGTAAKEAEITRPIEEAYTYAHNYLNNKNFTGPGDEALLAKFFELEKVSKGFRMTQPQINMLLNARGWTGTVAAKFRHATQGTWLDDDQRKQIVNTIDDLYKTKQSSRGGATVPAPQGNRPPLSSFER